MIKAAIFDLDGTLLDSMPYWSGLGEKYLRGIGIEPHEDLNESLKTFTFAQSAEYFRQHYGVKLSAEKMVDDMNELIEDHYKYDIPLKSGAETLLKYLAARGVKMCVATAAEKEHALSALSRLGVLDYFSTVFICSELDCNKTVPTVFRAALAHMGTKREETAVFEDSLYALETAKKDGFLTVAVFDPREKQQERLKELADVYLNELSEFITE